jgi:hypothetical protein
LFSCHTPLHDQVLIEEPRQERALLLDTSKIDVVLLVFFYVSEISAAGDPLPRLTDWIPGELRGAKPALLRKLGVSENDPAVR